MTAESANAVPPEMDARAQRPRVAYIGLRGIGNVQGGVEKHVLELVRHLSLPAGAVEVMGRRPYRDDSAALPAAVRQIWLPTVRHALLDTPIYLAACLARLVVRRPRLVHIHAIGPALIAPFVRMLGIPVVVTHHGEDYRREKWGWFPRLMLRLGEWCAVHFSDACIAISPVNAEDLRRRFAGDIIFIPNGVSRQAGVPPGAVLARYALTPQRYVVNVARLVPEKRQGDLITAFIKAAVPGVKLVLIGGSDHESAYAQNLSAMAAGHPDIVFVGHQHGSALAELFGNAGLFVLPSAHEGLPIALLEAMGFGLPVQVADLPVYAMMGLPSEAIYPLGDTLELARRIVAAFADRPAPAAWPMLSTYDWQAIADRTQALYERVLHGRSREGRHAASA